MGIGDGQLLKALSYVRDGGEWLDLRSLLTQAIERIESLEVLEQAVGDPEDWYDRDDSDVYVADSTRRVVDPRTLQTAIWEVENGNR